MTYFKSATYGWTTQVICDELLGGDGMVQLMPNVCKDTLCVYRYQHYDFMAHVAYILSEHNDELGLVVQHVATLTTKPEHDILIIGYLG